MYYTKNESKAILQVATAAAKNIVKGFWACDGSTLFTVGEKINLSVPCESNGAWVVPSRSFAEAIKGTKDISIDFDAENNTVNICGCNFKAMDFDNAENILNDSEQPINKGFYRIDRTADELLDAADFVSTDKTRINLTGVAVDSGIWATDGLRAKITNPIPDYNPKDNAVIIPANIIKWFGKLEAEFFASMDDSQILTTVDRVKIICDAIDGPYPRIRAVIPTTFDNYLHIDSRDFRKFETFLDRAKKIVKRTRKFVFIPCDNCLEIRAVDIDSGLEICETLENSYAKGVNPVNIAFDAANAQQIAKKIIKQNKQSEKIIIKYNTAISPTIWGDDYLLMPVRLTD